MTRNKAQLWHQAQQAQKLARTARMARYDLLGHGDAELERRALDLARVADGHAAAARACLDEMNALAPQPAADDIDWGDLTNYS